MSEIRDELNSKREALLARRGHLIRILALMVLLLSLIPIGLRVGSITNPSITFVVLISYVALALGVTVLIAIILCVGSLMAEYEIDEYRGVFYKGDIIKGDEKGAKYREAIREASNLMDIYDEAEEGSLTAIGLWAFAILWVTVFIILGELSIRGLQWVDSGWAEILLLILIPVFVIILPAIIVGLHILYLWREVARETEAWKYFGKKMGEGHDHLSKWRIYRWLSYPIELVS